MDVSKAKSTAWHEEQRWKLWCRSDAKASHQGKNKARHCPQFWTNMSNAVITTDEFFMEMYLIDTSTKCTVNMKMLINILTAVICLTRLEQTEWSLTFSILMNTQDKIKASSGFLHPHSPWWGVPAEQSLGPHGEMNGRFQANQAPKCHTGLTLPAGGVLIEYLCIHVYVETDNIIKPVASRA